MIKCLIITITFFSFFNLNFSLNSFIKNYDRLNYQSIHKIVRRSISDESNNYKIRLKFQAFKKNFYLVLNEDFSSVHLKTEFIVGGVLQNINGVTIVKGYVDNHPGSEVRGTLIDGIFRGTINIDLANKTRGKYYIEHSGYHFQKDPGFHSIIYHDSDINNTVNHCGWSDPEVAHNTYINSLTYRPKSAFNYNYKNTHLRRKRNSNSNGSHLVCNLFIQTDTFLWNRVLGLHHVNNQRHAALREISSIITQHVQGAQAIYQNSLFQTSGGNGRGYNGIGFKVDRVRINTTEDCPPDMINDNPFCSPNIDVTHFLNLNSYMNHDEFCLAYIFTYRDFNGGTLGLAWVAEPGGSGGVCEKRKLIQEVGKNIHKSLNTGIVTLHNYGSYVPLKISQLTFAHEMGHNFGSKHDDDHSDHPECLPSTEDPKGNYIMFASATSGEKENNNKFSPCSQDSIARLLDYITKKGPNNCFLNQEGSFCGNKLREEGEECDCGYSQKECANKCCNPKNSKSPCKLAQYFKCKKILCSPSAGECCTENCQFENDERICRYSGDCYEASYCLGNSKECPSSRKKADFTSCRSNTRICKSGECVGSICEKAGWQECSIAYNNSITPDMMCFVACKSPLSNNECISTFHLQKNSELRNKYQSLVKELMISGKAIQLKSGDPCDSFRGYCDIFLRCRSVEADGPLARIKNMIFSSFMVDKVKRWTTQFWWAVMLICIGGIIFVAIFLKVFSKSTPSSNHKDAKNTSNNHSHLNRHKHSHHRRIKHRQIILNKTNHSTESSYLKSNRVSGLPRSHSSNGRIKYHVRRSRRSSSMIRSRSAQAEPLSSTNIESNIELQGTSNNDVARSLVTRTDECIIVLPRQHGHGRGKKGHRRALDKLASRYSQVPC